ncbi:hypothetical protein SK128_009277 [Halocaridina rubra]|uniref:Centromere protein K n=1 Tax=Halocaridina rubra TaxID=373956 RepID=A0AAN9ABL0_HALRR
MEAESSDALASLDEMKAKIKEEIEELMASMMDVSLEGGAKLHADDSVDSLMKTKLHTASEVEATMNEKLLELPNDKTLLMKLAQEEAENMTINNARCLDFYQEKVRALEEEKNSFESLIQKATAVNDELDKLLAEQTKKDKLENLRRRYESSGILFLALRREMQFALGDLYPEQSESLSMEEFLRSLVTKMQEDNQDPYITIDDSIPQEYVTFLLRANLIVRHPDDALRIKFVDPRY